MEICTAQSQNLKSTGFILRKAPRVVIHVGATSFMCILDTWMQARNHI